MLTGELQSHLTWSVVGKLFKGNTKNRDENLRRVNHNRL